MRYERWSDYRTMVTVDKEVMETRGDKSMYVKRSLIMLLSNSIINCMSEWSLVMIAARVE